MKPLGQSGQPGSSCDLAEVRGPLVSSALCPRHGLIVLEQDVLDRRQRGTLDTQLGERRHRILAGCGLRQTDQQPKCLDEYIVHESELQGFSAEFGNLIDNFFGWAAAVHEKTNDVG